MDYKGQLNDKLQGFYKTKCLNSDGSYGYAAVTQFEATSARRALPCFDEPSFKATFEVVIVAEKSKTVLSNMVCSFYNY
jgi:aminopeptidase N